MAYYIDTPPQECRCERKDGQTHAPLAVGDEDVEAVDLALLKVVRVVRVAALRRCRERNDALLRLEVVLRKLRTARV